jgi:hypothetical protein
MKISKWVDMGQEVDIEIDFNDIRVALAEAFEPITRERLGEEGPSCGDVGRALNSMAAFLNALTDEHIAQLTAMQRSVIGRFLADTSLRFKVPAEATR